MNTQPSEQPQFLGHPTGLFVLFFAEMWERFSYYGMRALLVFYMLKGFLQYDDARAYGVYGAYTALVYMTPFFGGLIADRLLGPRIAVIIGGLLMAAGHFVMMFQHTALFYLALALLIAGNGFFKPNISAIVGQLYPPGSGKRDGGFTIFYMGINLGAAMSPLLCGYIGETYGWHKGFGLATAGMLAGLAIFVMPTLMTQLIIGLGSLVTALGLFYFVPDNPAAIAVNVTVALALLAAAVIAIRALALGGVPDDAGRPPGGVAKGLGLVLLGTAICIPLFTLFVSDFSILREGGKPIQLISDETIARLTGGEGALAQVGKIFLTEISKPAGILLALTGLLATSYLVIETFRLERVPRQRMYVVLTLTFFIMLFWAFFEQAGSSVNNFTDRNVDRVGESRTITQEDVGQTIQIQPTQEQLGHTNGGRMFTISELDRLRAENQGTDEKPGNPAFTIDWLVDAENVGMGIADRTSELAASMFQAVNPIFILLLGLVFTTLWTYLGTHGMEPPTPYKFAMGLGLLGLGFGTFWFGAQDANERGMVAVSWLILGYGFQTAGELCCSPVGLSMITKLTPKVLVSTVMGAWFLATAFSQYLAAIISQFTGVSHGGDGERVIPPPLETVNIYGDVFQKIAIAALVSAGVCLVLSPLLTKWMHEGEAESA